MSVAIKSPQSRSESNVYIFDEFMLDGGNWTLYCRDQAIHLAPKLIDTLVYLVEHAGETVSKGDLLRDVWPGQRVEESALARNISLLRTALGDVHPFRYIHTCKGHGYRFLGTVHVQTDGHSKDITRDDATDEHSRSIDTARWLIRSTWRFLLRLGFALFFMAAGALLCVFFQW